MQTIRVPCEAFHKNPDGSWTARRGVEIKAPGGTIRFHEGETFSAYKTFNGVLLARVLQQQCSRW